MEFFGSQITAVTWKTMKIQIFHSIEQFFRFILGGIVLFREGSPQFPFFLLGFYSLILGVPHNFQEPSPQS